ncbi:MAG: class I SAM-dependent methyltransferase [Hyphomicrobiales bacterium]|nr:class I SAM-dependent methyltransferase [Hyphomicrobiales bacterium]
MDDQELSDLHSGIIRYYSDRVQRFGDTPLGVDWTCVASQELRFVQLMKLCNFSTQFSLNDVGCGYGALVAYLIRRHPDADIDYLGIDLAQAMVRRAKRLWQAHPWTAFSTANDHYRPADYCVASGIFNVKQDQPGHSWERYIALTLDKMHAASRKGFAVNFMLGKSQPLDNSDNEALYRTRPETWIRHCEKEYGASVTLVEGYGQQEFTLLARTTYSNLQN